MARYTAYYHITFSIDIEADNYDEAAEIVDNMTVDDVLENVVLEDYWPEFEELIAH